MHVSVRSYLIAGVAAVGTGAMALSPVAPAPDSAVPAVEGLASMPNPVNVVLASSSKSLPEQDLPTIPDTTVRIAIAAFEESAAIFGATADELPGDAKVLAAGVAKDPKTLPLAVVQFNNILIDVVEVGGDPIRHAAIGSLPRPTRPAVVKIQADVKAVINVTQAVVTKAVTPKKPKKSAIGLTKTLGDKPSIKKVGAHRASEGRVSVRDLVKKATSG